MKISFRAGILGAGLGSRLRSRATAKPLVQVGGQSLLGHLVSGLRANDIPEIYCALREELLSPEDHSRLPAAPGLQYLFVNTESSLHTLGALVDAMGSSSGPVLFSMADTVLKRSDLKAFTNFCRGLKKNECAVLVTTFVQDEKPLWVHLDRKGNAVKFSSDPAQHITSGMYFLSPQAMEIAHELILSGAQKMRNFLAALAQRGIPIKTFVVSKTIDVDHPSDLDEAAEFLLRD
jgi:NDP-sugar pyrophosphorylase family protein